MGSSLDGKVAIITGASRGIGLAIAQLFSENAAHCVLLVRDRDAGSQAADQIGARPNKPVVAVADVSDRGAIASAVLEVTQRFPKVHIVVNNAGVLLDEDRDTPASTMDDLVLERTMAVNFLGPIVVSQAFLPYMERDARIINVSSTMGQLADGSAGYAPAYCMSKTALNAWTQALAEDLKPRGIMVDAFHPGWAKTEMGGPNATVDPGQAAQVALFLATRPHSTETGLFWRHPGTVIDW